MTIKIKDNVKNKRSEDDDNIALDHKNPKNDFVVITIVAHDSGDDSDHDNNNNDSLMI